MEIDDTNISESVDTAQIAAFALSSILNIQTVETVAEELKLQPLKTCGVMTLDASQVESITTPGIQLVLAAAIEIERHGNIFLITQPTAVFSQAFSDVGLKTWLSQREASNG